MPIVIGRYSQWLFPDSNNYIWKQSLLISQPSMLPTVKLPSQPLWINAYDAIQDHTMDMLWEMFKLILPLYMKQINFQSKTSVVCSVTTAVFVDFCLKKLNVVSQHIGKKNEYLNSTGQITRNWNVNLELIIFWDINWLMMQHQHIVKRINEVHEWAHRPYQLLSAPYHCHLYKHRGQDERQPSQSSWLVPNCTYT